MKTLKLEEFEKLNISFNNEYHNRSLLEQKLFLAEVQKFYPCELYITYEEYNDAFYFEYSECKLQHGDSKLDIIINKDYKNKFHIYSINRNSFKNLSSYDIERIKESFEKPKNIGVLSTKKISDWIDYLVKVNESCIIKNVENSDIISAFLEKVKPYNPTFWNNGKNGEIRKNGLIYEFEIFENYVSEKIKLDTPIENKFESFLKLSDNNFIDVK